MKREGKRESEKETDRQKTDTEREEVAVLRTGNLTSAFSTLRKTDALYQSFKI